MTCDQLFVGVSSDEREQVAAGESADLVVGLRAAGLGAWRRVGRPKTRDDINKDEIVLD
jgi:hypothetical protein